MKCIFSGLVWSVVVKKKDNLLRFVSSVGLEFCSGGGGRTSFEWIFEKGGKSGFSDL